MSDLMRRVKYFADEKEGPVPVVHAAFFREIYRELLALEAELAPYRREAALKARFEEESG